MANAATISLAGDLHKIKMGLGEAILRLVHVEQMYAQGFSEIPERLTQERQMIVEALNQFELDLGFDCDGDGIPDTVQIFEKSATDSCCRILPRDFSRRATKTGGSAGKPRNFRQKGSSRRKA